MHQNVNTPASAGMPAAGGSGHRLALDFMPAMLNRVSPGAPAPCYSNAMFELLKLACDIAAREGCQFADARYLDIRRQRVTSRDHALSGCSDSEDCGFGVRVLYQGAWGFASAPDFSAAEVEQVVALAIGIARASARAPRAGGVQWAPEPPRQFSYRSDCRVDPFAVALEE